MTSTRKRLLWLAGGCVALSACAKLGGFEDFSPGSSPDSDSGGTGGTADATGGADSKPGGSANSTRAGTAGAGKAGASSKGGTGGSAAGASPIGVDGGTAGAPDVEGQAGGGGSPSSNGGAPALLDDCVLLMHFEEASWSMKLGEVRDSSGLGNHGTASASTITTSPPGKGKFGRAAQLDGSGSVVVPDAPSLRASSALTVAAWIYPTTITGNGPGIITKRRGFGSDTAFGLFLYSSPVELYADVQGEDDRFHGLAEFLPAVWHHVALVYDGSLAQGVRSRLYVDGELDAVGLEHAAEIEPYTSDLFIGELPAGGDHFIGMIDEVAVWTRVLDPAEVHAVYAATVPL